MVDTERILRLLRPDRYVLVVFGFFVLFPVFMDVITPDVISGYAGGTVDAQGNVVSRYEGGNAPQYQWYYPILWPFIAIWYVSVLLFGFVDGLIPLDGVTFYLAQGVYFYLLALALGTAAKRLVTFGAVVRWRSGTGP